MNNNFNPNNYNNYINSNLDEINFKNSLEENLSDNSDESDDYDLDEYEFEDNNIIIEEKPTENIINEYNLIIDGKDRNWFFINPNRYSFEIIFNPNVNSIEYKKYPIYENNQYIPATKEQSKLGQRGNENTIGFLYNCVPYPKWNPNKMPGRIVGYDTIATKYYATNDLKCFKTLRNVDRKSINILRNKEISLNID